ncbi:MAG: undecaprenyldiphospho-muramoylpentapeptide beta-N-acetylglucosaminyltransferase [Bacteroidota bacterium]
MTGRPLTLVFAGGGTGGHLYPALAVADAIRRRMPDAAITFVGAKGRIESRVVPLRGYPFRAIWISGLRRKLSLETAMFPLQLVVSVWQSYLHLRESDPDAVVGTGGYVSGPVVWAAQRMGIPTLLQEQNSVPGITTRLLAKRAKEVHLTFESSRRHLERQDNVRISGNPTREGLGKVSRAEGAAFFQLDPTKKTVLVFGGSQGAATINAAMLGFALTLAAEGVQVIWQTGSGDYHRVREAMMSQEKAVRVHEFIDRMEMAYAACDLAVCRSGATSLAELTCAGVPAVLVPYAFAAHGHQTTNARAMVEAGAAVLVPDAEAAHLLSVVVRELLNEPARVRTMADAARRLGKPDAAAALADAVLRLAGRGTT